MDISFEWDRYCDMRDEWMEEFTRICCETGFNGNINEYAIEHTYFQENLTPSNAANLFLSTLNPSPTAETP